MALPQVHVKAKGHTRPLPWTHTEAQATRPPTSPQAAQQAATDVSPRPAQGRPQNGRHRTGAAQPQMFCGDTSVSRMCGDDGQKPPGKGDASRTRPRHTQKCPPWASCPQNSQHSDTWAPCSTTPAHQHSQ